MSPSPRSRNGRALATAVPTFPATCADNLPARSSAATVGTDASRRASATSRRSTPDTGCAATHALADGAPSSANSSRVSTSATACNATARSRSACASSTRVRSNATAGGSSTGSCPATASIPATSRATGSAAGSNVTVTLPPPRRVVRTAVRILRRIG
jgi:hypothetical protein